MRFVKIFVLLSILFSIFFLILRQLYWVQNSDPFRVTIHTSDIDNFWRVIDLARGETPSASDLNTQYLQVGTDGLSDYIDSRIQSAEHLAKMYSQYSQYYKSTRSSTEKIKDYVPSIINYCEILKDNYPPAVFPPIYFVIGAINSGGTTSFDSIVIGAEMYALHQKIHLRG